jgi:hypothetical protein
MPSIVYSIEKKKRKRNFKKKYIIGKIVIKTIVRILYYVERLWWDIQYGSLTSFV